MKRYILMGAISLGLGYAPSFMIAKDRTRKEKKEQKLDARRHRTLEGINDNADKKGSDVDKKVSEISSDELNNSK